MTGLPIAKVNEGKLETLSSAPYALYGSDNPRAMITLVMLTGENYNQANEMLNALQAKRKVGLINGKLQKSAPDNVDYEN